MEEKRIKNEPQKIFNFFSHIGNLIKRYAKNYKESYYNLLSL
jgi:hypothetical protein